VPGMTIAFISLSGCNTQYKENKNSTCETV